MKTSSTVNTVKTISSVPSTVYRFVVDVLHSGHAMERRTYRYD